jgi:hypothetical protein
MLRGYFFRRGESSLMIKSDNQMKSEIKELFHDIYIIGQESESMETNDFIKVIESKLLSLQSFKNKRTDTCN